MTPSNQPSHPFRFDYRLGAFLLLAAAVGVVFASCSETSPSPAGKQKAKRPAIMRTRFVKPAPVAQHYVGSEACRECHAEIMDSYQTHAMSDSMSIPASDPIANYDSVPDVKATDNWIYQVQKIEDNNIIHRELFLNADGQPIVEFETPIDFTCGSGTRGCSYFMLRDGKLYQSPLTWYGKSKSWDLSPGYAAPIHPRFERLASDGCLACHAGRMNPVPNERSTFVHEKPFHELEIGCERCHGPAAKHIDYHSGKKGETSQAEKDPIVNPIDLQPELRDAVCYQCHLQGENRITRYGRSEYDFRPGMKVSDIWVTFLKSGKAIDGKTDAVSQVEQMRQSKCFTASDGAFGCISCHDPHGSPAPKNRIQFYRDQCIQCHQSDDQPDCGMVRSERLKSSPEDSCFQCHMPQLNAGDVPHTPQTDHRVQLPGSVFDYRAASNSIWVDAKLPSHVLSRAKTIALAQKAFAVQSPELAEEALSGLSDFHPPAEDDLPLNEALAQIDWVRGEQDQAIRLWKKLLKQAPNDEYLLYDLAVCLQQSGRSQEAYDYFKRLIAINGNRSQSLKGLLDVCTDLNKIAEGVDVANRILRLEPGSITTHQWLVQAYRRSGNTELEKRHSVLADALKKTK